MNWPRCSPMRLPRTLETETITIRGWAGDVVVENIKGKKITVVPILRAGLGMMDGVLNLIPSAKNQCGGGLYRNEETLEPVRYYVKMTSKMEERIALILDPMLATGGTPDGHHRPAQKSPAAGRSVGCFWLPPPKGSNGWKRPIPMWTSMWRPSTKSSTTSVTSCRDWVMPAIKYSAPSNSRRSENPLDKAPGGQPGALLFAPSVPWKGRVAMNISFLNRIACSSSPFAAGYFLSYLYRVGQCGDCPRTWWAIWVSARRRWGC